MSPIGLCVCRPCATSAELGQRRWAIAPTCGRSYIRPPDQQPGRYLVALAVCDKCVGVEAKTVRTQDCGSKAHRTSRHSGSTLHDLTGAIVVDGGVRVVDDKPPRAIWLLSNDFRAHSSRCQLGRSCRCALDYPFTVQQR